MSVKSIDKVFENTSESKLKRLGISPPFGKPMVTIKAEIASTEQELDQGLMFRKNLPDFNGMLFKLPYASYWGFWMKNTCISLDILFIDRLGRITDIYHHVPPFTHKSHCPSVPVPYVLELNGGFCKQHRITEEFLIHKLSEK